MQDRPRLLQEKTAIEEQLKNVSEQFQEMCSNLLPFSMIADLGIDLERTLDRERKTVNWHAAKEATYPQLTKAPGSLALRAVSPAEPRTDVVPTPILTSTVERLLVQSLRSAAV